MKNNKYSYVVSVLNKFSRRYEDETGFVFAKDIESARKEVYVIHSLAKSNTAMLVLEGE